MKMRGRDGYVVALAERTDELLSGGQLLALVDTLRNGTSDANQREAVHTLRFGILALVERQMAEVV